MAPILSLFAAVAYLATSVVASPIEVEKRAPQKYLFAFGDSYSQIGFNITLEKPSATNPFGNPPFPGWTTSGGPNWLGYLTAKYNASKILTYNFAYGGATVDSTIVPPYAPTVLSLVDQVAIFSNNVASKPPYAPWTSKDSTFAFWIGINDIGQSWWQEGQEERFQKIFDQYFNQVQILHKAGARRFVFLNILPVTRSPMVLTTVDEWGQKQWQLVIDQFNTALAARIKQFSSTQKDSKVYAIDTVADSTYVFDNPTKFGAANATCYNADGVSCLWWNDYHPGLAIHDVVAKRTAKVVGSPFKSVK